MLYQTDKCKTMDVSLMALQTGLFGREIIADGYRETGGMKSKQSAFVDVVVIKAQLWLKLRP